METEVVEEVEELDRDLVRDLDRRDLGRGLDRDLDRFPGGGLGAGPAGGAGAEGLEWAKSGGIGAWGYSVKGGFSMPSHCR